MLLVGALPVLPHYEDGQRESIGDRVLFCGVGFVALVDRITMLPSVVSRMLA